MPNIKSAKKRVRVTEKKTLINMAHKTALKTAIKKFEAAAKAGNKEEAQQLFNEAAKKLDQSVNRGVLLHISPHFLHAARKKSQLALKLAKLA